MPNPFKSLKAWAALVAVIVLVLLYFFWPVQAHAAEIANAVSSSDSNATSAAQSVAGSNSSPTNNLIINGADKTEYAGTYTVRSAPNMIAPIVYPTAPCIVGISAGASWISAAFTLGGGYKDDDCTIRETLRLGDVIGLDAYTRKQVACQSPVLAKTDWCKNTEPPTVTVTVEKIVEKPVEVIKEVPGPTVYVCPDHGPIISTHKPVKHKTLKDCSNNEPAPVK